MSTKLKVVCISNFIHMYVHVDMTVQMRSDELPDNVAIASLMISCYLHCYSNCLETFNVALWLENLTSKFTGKCLPCTGLLYIFVLCLSNKLPSPTQGKY